MWRERTGEAISPKCLIILFFSPCINWKKNVTFEIFELCLLGYGLATKNWTRASRIPIPDLGLPVCTLYPCFLYLYYSFKEFVYKQILINSRMFRLKSLSVSISSLKSKESNVCINLFYFRYSNFRLNLTFLLFLCIIRGRNG